MKKILAVVVHLLSLGMVIVSIYILYANSNFGRGFTWLQVKPMYSQNFFITSCSRISVRFLIMSDFRKRLKPMAKSIREKRF